MRFLVAGFVLVAILFSFSAASAELPILVRVEVGDRAEGREVGEILNLDEKTRGTTLYGWGTVKEIEAVEKLGYVVEVVPPELKDPDALTMCSEPFAAPFPFNCYPTWSQFETMLNYYAATYPGIVRLVNLGMSGEGDHELWALKISDNPDVEENEPEVLYTGTMHGDELVCYGTNVHLIDHILANYGSDSQITRLVNETVLWFNPLSNPDGTFGGGRKHRFRRGPVPAGLGCRSQSEFSRPERARGSDECRLAGRGPGDDRFRRRRTPHPCGQLPRGSGTFQLSLGYVDRAHPG